MGAKMRRLRDQATSTGSGAPAMADRWLKPTLGGDRRWTARAAVRFEAAFREWQSARSDVQVVNFSRYGCAIESKLAPAAGVFCWLKVPTLESWYAKVAWREGDIWGLDFADPFHPAVADMIVRRARSLPGPSPLLQFSAGRLD
jgi:hypothetical protein